ncbi:MAG: hypothetical protein ACUVSV_13770, partial [Armatimonadota bacterium]
MQKRKWMLISSLMLMAIAWAVTANVQPETQANTSEQNQEQCADCHSEVAEPFKQHAHAGLS